MDQSPNASLEILDNLMVTLCPLGCDNISSSNLFPCSRPNCTNTGLDYLHVLRVNKINGFEGSFVQYSAILCKICYKIIHDHKIPITPLEDDDPLTFQEIFDNSSEEVKNCLSSHSIYNLVHDKYIWKQQNIGQEEIEIKCLECGIHILYFKIGLENDFHSNTEAMSTINYTLKKESLSDIIVWKF